MTICPTIDDDSEHVDNSTKSTRTSSLPLSPGREPRSHDDAPQTPEHRQADATQFFDSFDSPPLDWTPVTKNGSSSFFLPSPPHLTHTSALLATFVDGHHCDIRVVYSPVASPPHGKDKTASPSSVMAPLSSPHTAHNVAGPGTILGKSAEVARLRKLVSGRKAVNTSTTTATMATAASNNNDDDHDRSFPTSSNRRLASSRGQLLFKKRLATLQGNQRGGTNDVNTDCTANGARGDDDGNGKHHCKNGLGKSHYSVSSHHHGGRNSDQGHGAGGDNAATVQEYFRQSNPGANHSKSILSHKIFQQKKKLSPLLGTNSSLPLCTRGRLSSISPKKKKYPTISELCAAIRPIQNLARQYLAKRALERRKKSIVVVQSVLRTWMARRRYLFVRQKIIQIQSLHRGNLDRSVVYILRSIVHVAITLQKWYRGIVARTKIALQQSAATLIQSQTRRYVARRQYRSILRAIVAFQSLARMHPHHERYKQEMIAKRCATKIQSTYRGYCQRIAFHELKMEHEKATVIQSKWRAVRCRTEYAWIVWDVVTVQSVVRRMLGVRRSQAMRTERDAAVVIQSRVRGHRAASFYLQMLGGIVLSQCVIRRWLAQRLVDQTRMEKRENEEKEAARHIQTAWRGFVVRREYITTVQRVTLCQSAVRRFLSSRRVEKIRYHKTCIAAATVIQSICRTWAATQDYIKTITFIIVAQSVLRRWMACRYVRELREEERLRQEYLASVSAAIKIATCWRRSHCKSEYRKVVADVVVCQSVVRRCIAVAQAGSLRYERSVAAATKIQAMWRCFTAMDLYFEMIMDVVVVQSIARRLLSTRLCVRLKEDKRLLEEAAAVKIASTWRGLVCLLQYKQSVRDIIVCQSVARRNIAVSRAARLRQDQRIASATIIQATWRARVARDVFILTLFDIITLQSFARRLVAQRIVGRLKEEKHLVEVSAATAISSSWRRFACLRAYRRTIADILICQSVFRQNMALKEAEGLLLKKHEEVCASVIQEIWRAYVARERLVTVLSNMEKQKLVEAKSATDISKTWRRFATRRKYLSISRNVRLCQTLVRRHLAKNEVRSLKAMLCNSAATVIQTKWRTFAASNNFYRVVTGIVALQSITRKFMSSRRLVQLQVDGRLKERLVEADAATKIATSWRRFNRQTYNACNQRDEQLRLEKSVAGASHVLSTCRGHVGIDLLQNLNGKLELLSLFRQLIEEVRFVEEAAATKIASVWRGFAYSRAYKHALRDVVLCQSLVRRNFACEKVRKLRCERRVSCAKVIQSVWRAHQSRSRFTQTNFNIVMVQCFTRKCIAIKTSRQLTEEKSLREAAGKKIALAWRTYTGATEHESATQDMTLYQCVGSREFAMHEKHEGCVQLTLKKQRCHLVKQLVAEVMSNMEHLKQMEVAEAKKIPKSQRGLLNRREYMQSPPDLSACQSVARQWPASCKVDSLQNGQIIASSTLIQSKWRALVASRRFIEARTSSIVIQSLVRQWIASRRLNVLKMKKYLVSVVAATKITTSWRRYRCRSKFERTIEDVLVCQSAVRRNIGMRALESLRQNHRFTSASRIQATSRGHTPNAQRKSAYSISSILMLQSIVRRWLYKRQFSSMRDKSKKEQGAATKIQASWFAFYWRRKYILTISDVILCQAIARRFMACKHYELQQSICRQKTIRSDASSEKILSNMPFESAISSNVEMHSNYVRHTQERQFQITDDKSKASPPIPMLYHPLTSERQSIIRKMSSTNKIERLLMGCLPEQQIAATKIQAAYRQHFYRVKWLLAIRVIVKCQSAIRRRRAGRRIEELRFIKKQGPKDIFDFIKKRNAATKMIQRAYRYYATRNFESSYNNYLRRLHHAAENTSSNEPPLPHEAGPLNEVSFYNLAVQCNKTVDRNLDSDVYDLLLEESPNGNPKEEAVSTNVREMDSAISGLGGESLVADNKLSYVVEEDTNLKRHCRKHSSCGLSDQVHDVLLRTGKWFYDKLGSPGEDTPEDLLTVTEISEDVAFCCCKKAATGRTATSGVTVRTRENQDEISSAIAIQSQWRCYIASKHFSKLRLRNVVDNVKNEDNRCNQYKGRCAASGIEEQLSQTVESVIPSQSLVSIKHQSRITPAATTLDEAFAESAIIRFQRALRGFPASRHVEELMSTRQVSFTKNARSPDRKHVRRTGQIEIILNEGMEEDATLTDYSETESSDGEVQDDLIEDETLTHSEMIVNIAVFSQAQIPTSEHQHGLTCNPRNISEVLPCCDKIHHAKIKCAEANTSNSMLNSDALSHDLDTISSKEGVASHAECFVLTSSSLSSSQATEGITKADLPSNLTVTFDERSDIFEADLPLRIFASPPHRNTGDGTTLEFRQKTDSIPCVPTQTNNRAILATETEEANLTLAEAKGDDFSCVSDVSNGMKFQSKCFDHSRCGLSDNVHELLIESGKWIYERVGDPGEDTAEKLVTAMEIGEEAAYCCWSPVPREITEF